MWVRAAASPGETGTDEAFALYAFGNTRFREGRYEEAAASLGASVRLDPTRAEAFNDLAAALFALGREAEALTSLRRALDLKPDLAEAEETDAIWLLRYGRFREGWRKYEARFRTYANQNLPRWTGVPRWSGEPLNGRRILLYSEQGLGDTVQFVRYAPLVAQRGGQVILDVYPQLRPVLNALPGAATIVPRGGSLPPFDLACPLLSLPLAFHTDLDSMPANIPYLGTPADRIAFWRHRLGPRRGLRVGIVWSGNPDHRDDKRRSLPFVRFAAALPDDNRITFHAVQAEVRESDRPALAAHPRVEDHSAGLRDFGDTAALLTLLDLVIGVDTSVMHLAGALGRPAWLLLSHIADWRWMLARDDSPWYPTIELFRQPARGDWDSVLASVRLRLQEMLY